jgi:hypothetical protein
VIEDRDCFRKKNDNISVGISFRGPVNRSLNNKLGVGYWGKDRMGLGVQLLDSE